MCESVYVHVCASVHVPWLSSRFCTPVPQGPHSTAVTGGWWEGELPPGPLTPQALPREGQGVRGGADTPHLTHTETHLPPPDGWSPLIPSLPQHPRSPPGRVDMGQKGPHDAPSSPSPEVRPSVDPNASTRGVSTCDPETDSTELILPHAPACRCISLSTELLSALPPSPLSSPSLPPTLPSPQTGAAPGGAGSVCSLSHDMSAGWILGVRGCGAHSAKQGLGGTVGGDLSPTPTARKESQAGHRDPWVGWAPAAPDTMSRSL